MYFKCTYPVYILCIYHPCIHTRMYVHKSTFILRHFSARLRTVSGKFQFTGYFATCLFTLILRFISWKIILIKLESCYYMFTELGSFLENIMPHPSKMAEFRFRPQKMCDVLKNEKQFSYFIYIFFVSEIFFKFLGLYRI